MIIIIRGRIASVGNVEADETVNHMISVCRQLAPKEYKTRHDWVGKVIYWELRKRLKKRIRQTNCTCRNQNSSKEMRLIEFSRILGRKRITKFRLKD